MSAPSQKRPFERLIGLYNHAFFISSSMDAIEGGYQGRQKQKKEKREKIYSEKKIKKCKPKNIFVQSSRGPPGRWLHREPNSYRSIVECAGYATLCSS